MPEKRKIQLHFTIASYELEKCGDSGSYPHFSNRVESGIMTVDLLENFPVKVFSVPLNFGFPLILSANFLRHDSNELSRLSDPPLTQQNRHLDGVDDHILSV